MDYKTISTKVSIDELDKIRLYCKTKGVSPSALIREAVLGEIGVSVPQNVAGKNYFEYYKEKDTFSWWVHFDTGHKVRLIDDVSPEFVKDLEKVIAGALNQRGNAIMEHKQDSVAIPGKFFKKKVKK